MTIRSEALQNLSADPLSGRIRRHLLGVLGLQLLQAAVEQIVFTVADGGRIQHIIAVTMFVQGVPQLFDLFTVVHGVPPCKLSRERAVKRRFSPARGAIHRILEEDRRCVVLGFFIF